jgi:hypothetical protein
MVETAFRYQLAEICGYFLLTLPNMLGYPIFPKGGERMQAYCMKCRTKREMRNARAITMKNGKPATQGVCPVCGTKMFRIGKS